MNGEQRDQSSSNRTKNSIEEKDNARESGSVLKPFSPVCFYQITWSRADKLGVSIHDILTVNCPSRCLMSSMLNFSLQQKSGEVFEEVLVGQAPWIKN